MKEIDGWWEWQSNEKRDASFAGDVAVGSLR
jgi:hypothetical protein